MSNIVRKSRTSNAIMLVAVPVGICSALYFTRLSDITFQEWLLTLILVFISWASFRNWRLSTDGTLRVFPLLSAMYSVYYVLALFWGQRVAPGAGRGRPVAEPMIEKALFFAVFAVCCLWLGMRCGVGRHLMPRKVLEIAGRETSWNYVRALLLVSIPLSFVSQGSLAYLFGSAGRQFMMVITQAVPLVLLVLIVQRVLRKSALPADFLLLIAFLFVRMLSSISSGWLGAGASIMMVCGAVYLFERRRVPVTGVILLLLYMLFYQAGKEGFRQVYWGERVESTISERISFWSAESLRNWQTTLNDSSRERWQQFSSQSLGRISLLQQTANIINMTPDVVPYQQGRTYLYMIVGFIPRAVWPDKPSVNDANRFYQVAYGITDPDALESVSVSAGAVAESFINFGWMGPLLIMFPLGIFLDFFEHTFLTQNSGTVLNAIGIAILPSLLGVESQVAVYLAGLLQAIVLPILVLAPILTIRRRSADATAPFAGPGVGKLRGFAPAANPLPMRRS